MHYIIFVIGFIFIIIMCVTFVGDHLVYRIYGLLILDPLLALGDFDLFKNHLDIFLSMVPDQPTIPGLVRSAGSNSLLDQVPLIHHQT